MRQFAIVALVAIATACSKPQPGISTDVHLAEVEQWHSKRIENLKGPQGWLNLAGLFWLKEGMNTFGAAEDNDLVFPSGKIADHAGYFMLRNGTVSIEAGEGSDIQIAEKPVTSFTVFHPDSAASKTPRMEHGTLLWFIIERDGKFGVRLRDFESEELSNFHGIERYPVSIDWRIEATLEKAEAGKTIDITNILGQTTPSPSPGTLVFAIDGTEYRLDAIDEGGPDLFVIFGDPTNEKETYPSGRYVYVSPPDEEGRIFIDFNKCYNPPCAFTPFATCPLPPRQNILPVPVLAGEKKYVGASHKTI